MDYESFLEQSKGGKNKMRRQGNLRFVETIFITIVLALFLPSLCLSGNLEPSEQPGPTMRTLDELYNKPVWKMLDKTFVDWPSNPRFAVYISTSETRDDMVLDKETGLVWERRPGLGSSQKFNWYDSMELCMVQGWGRHGWRLPTIHELKSLMAYCADTGSFLPCGHPFLDVRPGYVNGNPQLYWSATTSVSEPNAAYAMFMSGGNVWAFWKTDSQWNGNNVTYELYHWCVRGGSGPDAH